MNLRSMGIALMAIGAAHSQTAPALKMEFDVASVKQNKSDARFVSNIPLGLGDDFTPNGGLFSVSGAPLAAYISFAYSIPNPARATPVARVGVYRPVRCPSALWQQSD